MMANLRELKAAGLALARMGDEIDAAGTDQQRWRVFSCANYHRFAVDGRESAEVRCALCGTETVREERDVELAQSRLVA